MRKNNGDRRAFFFAYGGLYGTVREKWDVYLNGPPFLYGPEETWPEMKISRTVRPKWTLLETVNINALSVLSDEQRAFSLVWDIASSVEIWPLKIRKVANFLRGTVIF